MSKDNRRQVGFIPALAQAAARFRQFTSMPSTLMGYLPIDGNDPEPLQGDHVGPYVTVPPDLSEAAVYFPEGLVPAQEAPGTGLPPLDALDVRGARTVTVYIVYESGGAGQAYRTLTVVPQSAVVFEGKGTEMWVNYGVVNPILLGSQLYAAETVQSLESYSTAFRDTFVSQLDWSVIPGEPNTIMLTFDVTNVAMFRLLFGETSRTNGVPSGTLRAAIYTQLGR